MPDWLTTLLAALLGGFLSLAGVWIQLHQQRRKDEAAARSEASAVFTRVLGVLQQYNPDRAQRMIAAQEPMAGGWDADQVLGPLRDSLASGAADEPGTSEKVFQLVDLLYAYFDGLPHIDHWENERPVVSTSVSDEERRALYDEAREIARALLLRRDNR